MAGIGVRAPAGQGRVRFIWLRPPSFMGTECERRARAMDPAVIGRMQGMAETVKNYMKSNAPWQDRTHAARDGLDSNVNLAGHSTTLSAFHTVPYGGYLETGTSHMGAFPIIRPALQAHYAQVKAIMNDIAG
jgi:HK97 gp10 family phage protein